LAKQRESPISVNSRIQNLKTQISNLEKDLAEARKFLAKSEKTYSEFTREEIDIANKDLEALKIQEIQE
jgi:septal ring factor EnvC (AmiA/AmiB activator)